MSDYTDADRQRRLRMEESSQHLLAALCREHPHIIAHLQRQQRNKGSK